MEEAISRSFVGLHYTYPDLTGKRIAEGGRRISEGPRNASTDPLVTIITVCFNSARTIEMTFESVSQQTYSNIEYIVIDGGSTDGTVALLEKNASLIDYFVSEPDTGLYDAMNKGLSLASGDYILILNSDDWYEWDAVERLVQAKRTSQCDFVGALARYINADGSTSVLPSMRYDHATLMRMPLRHQTMLMSAEVYEEIGPYDTDFPIIADFDLAIRLYLAGKSYFEVSAPLLNFRTTGVSSTALDRLHAEHKALLRKVFPFLSTDEAERIFNHSVLSPDDLLAVAVAHWEQTDFVLAARDMIGDFARVWGGKWAEFDIEQFDTAGQPAYPKISVVIPVHNAEHIIKATLQTLRDQDFQSFEAICVDDCSSDGSASVIRAIMAQDPRLRLIELHNNKGAGGARNEGIRAARGSYVFFLDADDALMPEALSRLFATARANGSDIVRGAFKVTRRIHDRSVDMVKYPSGKADHEIAKTNLQELPSLLQTTEGHWACLYDRSFVETILYPEKLSMGEDSLFLIHALVRAQIVSVIPDVVYHYQDNDASAMNNYNFKKYMDDVEWRRRSWGILANAGLNELGDYFLYNYWDPSSLGSLPVRLSASELTAFYTALRDAFTAAGGAVADKCMNANLSRLFQEGFAATGLVEEIAPRRRPLTVAMLTSMDSGGAGIAAIRCMEAQRKFGQAAFTVSIFQQKAHSNVFGAPLLPEPNALRNAGDIPGLWSYWFDRVALTDTTSPSSSARELFSKPESIMDNAALARELAAVDVLHLHWVVGMLDFPNLGDLVGTKPVIWTLHDMNPITGGCHYSEGCDGYRYECRNCPLVEPRSNIAEEAWAIKKLGLAQIRNLHIVCPSQWLADRVAESSLLGDRPIHVIPNHIPLTQFSPTNKMVARMRLDIPLDKKYIVFGADSLNNKRKGGHHLVESLEHLRRMGHAADVEVLLFGNASLDVGVPTRNMGHVSNQHRLSLIYAAADVYAFPSLEDNAPQTVVEAMLSGTPVVGFPVGNVPDLVADKETGYIALYADSRDFAQGLVWALSKCRQPEAVLRGLRAHVNARDMHDPASIVRRHQDLYQLAAEQAGNPS